MPFTTQADNQSLDALNNINPTANLLNYATLHTAYSASGANELSGGSPAYARVALTWSAAGGGSKAMATAASAFNVPAGQTVAFVGLTSAVSAALSASNFAGMGANGGATMFAFTAATSGNLFTAPGTTYANTQAVVIWSGVGATTPGGFTVGTIYYVTGVSGATFTLAATSGGSAITVSAAGSGLVQAITLESFGAQGTFTLTADTLSVI